MVKAALLYGERVRLLSPIAAAVTRAARLTSLTDAQLMHLLEQVNSELDEPLASESFDQLKQLTRGRARSREEVILRRQLSDELRTAAKGVQEALLETVESSGFDELDLARRNGLLEIIDLDAGEALDFVASCIRSAARAGRGQRPRDDDDSGTDRFISSFVTALERSLSDASCYPMFDSGVGDLVGAALREGAFQVSGGGLRRATQGATAGDLIGRLPAFPAATVGEVLDVRRELESPIVRFRAEVARLSSEFQSSAFDQEFQGDLGEAWNQKVAPAIEEIRDLVAENTYMRQLTTRFVTEGLTVSAAITAAAYAGTGVSALPLAVATVLGGTWAATRAGMEREAEERRIARQPFYLLYRTQASLDE